MITRRRALPERPRNLEPEWLDTSSLSVHQSGRALRDLARVNFFLLSRLPVLRTVLPRVLARATGDRQVLVDLGTGLGDIPAALGRAAGRRGVVLSLVGVDRKLSHLVLGRRLWPDQLRVVADAQALPFAGASVDWCLSTLFFHHFDATANRKILDEMRRIAGQAAVVVDLRRSRLTSWLVRLFLPVLGVGRVAWHDGIESARRSYTPLEVTELLQLGVRYELRRGFPLRFVLVLPPKSATRGAC